KHWAGIDDDEERSQQKLATAVGSVFPDEHEEVFPFIATLMGMRLSGTHAARIEGMAGDSLEKLILKAMRDLLQQLARTTPLVLFFEDLHWADLSSIKLLEPLLRLAGESRILF